MSDLVMLATTWDPSVDPTGMWMSEKLDGVLALWDGEGFMTRLGNRIRTPEWFIRHMPADRLLGELFLARGKFPETLSIVRRARPFDLDWARMTYRVFDMPDVDLPYERRLMGAIQSTLSFDSCWRGDDTRPAYARTMPYPIRIVNQTPCKSREHFDQFHAAIVAAGGEGTMLRRALSPYRVGRSIDLMKRKDWLEDEARVVSYNMRDGGLRSLRCELLSDASVVFDVGSGLTAADLVRPPRVGDIVTVKYKERTASNALREPSFVCVRNYE